MTAPCATPIMGLPPATSFDTFYIGKAGAMVKLRAPDSGYSSNMSRGEVAHQNTSGGTTVSRRPRTKRIFVVPMSGMTPDDAETLLSYYLGGFGNGPWCVMVPEFRNQLSQQASTFGQVLGVNDAWHAPATDTAALIDSTIAAPIVGGKPLGTAVLRWPSPVNGHYLFDGTNNGGTALVPSTTYGVPYLGDQPAKVNVWLRSASGTPTVTLYALGLAAAGWDGTTDATLACVLSTTWQRFSISLAAGAFAGLPPYLGIAVKSASASSPDVLLAAAQIEYGVTGTNLNPWTTGLGVARCSFAAGVGSKMTVYWRRDHSFTLAEN